MAELRPSVIADSDVSIWKNYYRPHAVFSPYLTVTKPEGPTAIATLHKTYSSPLPGKPELRFLKTDVNNGCEQYRDGKKHSYLEIVFHLLVNSRHIRESDRPLGI